MLENKYLDKILVNKLQDFEVEERKLIKQCT